MAEESNILKEAIAEAKSLREAAMHNAKEILAEHYKDDIKNLMESQLNEMADEDEDKEDDDNMDENLVGGQDHLDQFNIMEEEEDMDLDLGLDDKEDEGLDFDDDEEDADLGEGYSEDELEEALASALQEVDHGDLGEMEYVDPDKRADSRGISDEDTKEAGWEEKTAPASTQAEIYGKHGKYHEAKKHILKLVKENLRLKKEVRRARKAVVKLSEAVNEQKLFNAKLFYTHKLLENKTLRSETRDKIVESMDSVGTISEAKRNFGVWKQAIAEMGGQAGSKGQRSLSEALGSGVRETRGVDTQSLNEGAFTKSRFMKLAKING